jgi:hypothetical protein
MCQVVANDLPTRDAVVEHQAPNPFPYTYRPSARKEQDYTSRPPYQPAMALGNQEPKQCLPGSPRSRRAGRSDANSGEWWPPPALLDVYGMQEAGPKVGQPSCVPLKGSYLDSPGGSDRSNIAVNPPSVDTHENSVLGLLENSAIPPPTPDGVEHPYPAALCLSDTVDPTLWGAEDDGGAPNDGVSVDAASSDVSFFKAMFPELGDDVIEEVRHPSGRPAVAWDLYLACPWAVQVVHRLTTLCAPAQAALFALVMSSKCVR